MGRSGIHFFEHWNTHFTASESWWALQDSRYGLFSSTTKSHWCSLLRRLILLRDIPVVYIALEIMCLVHQLKHRNIKYRLFSPQSSLSTIGDGFGRSTCEGNISQTHNSTFFSDADTIGRTIKEKQIFKNGFEPKTMFNSKPVPPQTENDHRWLSYEQYHSSRRPWSSFGGFLAFSCSKKRYLRKHDLGCK